MNPIIRKVYYALPVKFRYLVRRIMYLPSDIFRDKNELVPPKGMIFTGRGNYRKAGEETFGHFSKYGSITPQSYILDIGSGIGRMAVPFTKYLDDTGRYEGFDIVKMGVDWCTKNISSKYPNFTFKHIELKKVVAGKIKGNQDNNCYYQPFEVLLSCCFHYPLSDLSL